jgi:hypothetical protein
MTKKDYIRAANIVQGIKSGEHAPMLAWQAREAFVVLFAENPRFDAAKFRKACGPIPYLWISGESLVY